ncbi:sensor histidine kinase [Oscillibacter sp.]|uniref:sensor histidine kinase n=1 Tax=Oscillibacter sp. TaxID=1945593 RepID=UPI002D7E4516|nr:HAMP domain-containing sensor histidine kinase [Oscillibacter sp.]
MTEAGYLCLAALALLAAFLWERRRTRRLLRRLDRMLDEAVRGDFREEVFDETLLSNLETKLAHYLGASAVSARNLQAERDKIKTLIADISHQTKTPIANVLLYTQLLEERAPEDCRAYTAALGEQAGKLQSLIDALVKTSRLETGVLVLHPRPGPLGPMLEEAVSQFAPRAAEKGLDLILEPTEADAVFDPKWTAEAVCNLIDNAVKYTPSGRVAVSARAYELFARIDVEDTGPGVPEEELGKLFQRFYRGGAASQAEGVGVGLYLVRQIAQGQGGYVKAFSRPGKGAKFSLFLPRN